MGTRGKGYLLLEDICIQSTEFNGDMYPSEYGTEFFNGLSESKSRHEFEVFIKKFNDKHFKYIEDLLYSVKKKDFYDLMTNEELVVNFNNDYFGRFFSDYIYIKNLSGYPVVFITRIDEENGIGEQVVRLLHGETAGFMFGR